MPKQARVLLEGRAATCRVGNDGIYIEDGECGHVSVRERVGSFDLAIVQVKRAAAALSTRNDHIAAIPRQYVDSVPIGLGEKLGHEATLEKRDAVTSGARRRDEGGQPTREQASL